MQNSTVDRRNIEIHLPSGRVAPLTEIVELCPYTLDFNLPYFHSIIESFIALDPAHGSFHFLFTRRVNQLPDYKPAKLKKLIVFLLGDEWCRVPSYAKQVLAVFKCYGSSPKLSLRRSAGHLNSLILLQHLRVICKNPTRAIAYKKNVFPFPLGYFRQSDLPVREILTRTCDVSFVGSVQNAPSQGLFSKIKSLLRSPKTLSRLSMVSQVSQWQNPKSHNIDVRLTSQFPHAEKSSELSDYSEKMMNSKICLSPRGTSLETFRYFEALRYGCVLISEPVPHHWFYQGSPAIYLKDWGQLPALIEALLSDSDRLVELHQEALRWWQNKCSPAAVSAQMQRDLSLLETSSL